MTKEPIIIDGVDVAECEYWNGSELGYCNIGLWANDGTHICECEPNCYYKQLKRKEQECEKLKIDNKEQKRQLRVRASILNTYKQALQDIKNVAENILIECNHCDQYSCSGCPDENKEELAQQILQTISEVIDD